MKYIYPINIDAVMAEGHRTSAPDVFNAETRFVNGYYANDQNIEFGLTGVAANEALRFDFVSSVTPDSLAIYVGTGAAGIAANIWRSSDGSALTSVSSISAGDLTDTGWYIKTFSGVAARYYILEFTGTVGSFSPHEIYFGNTFTFPYNYNLGNSYRKIYGVDSVGNASGDEFTNKRHAAKWVRTWGWSNFSQTNIDNMETFDTAIDGVRAKFLWHDDSQYWWVKQTVGLNYTEAGYLAFDPSSGLRQQLF